MQKTTLVFHIPKWYPKPEDDLFGIFVKRHIASTLVRSKAVVLFAVASNNTDNKWINTEYYDDEGIATYRSFYKKKYTGINFIDKIIKAITYYYAILLLWKIAVKKHGMPKLIHAHVLVRTGLIAYFLHIKHNIPYVISEHCNMFTLKKNALKNPLRKWACKWAVKNAAFVLPTSMDLQTAMIDRHKLYNPNYKIIYNNVNNTVFHPKDIYIKNGKKRFLHVTEFCEVFKNTTGLLKGIKLLSEQRSDFELHIIGYGQDEEAIKTLSKNLDLTDKFVFFRGKITGEKLANEMCHADYFVLNSRSENLPCVLLEAFSCGLPVITTNVGGISEIMNNENGFLIPPENEDLLVSILNQSLSQIGLFDKEKIAAYGYNHFSFDTIGLELNNIYEKIAKENV